MEENWNQGFLEPAPSGTAGKATSWWYMFCFVFEAGEKQRVHPPYLSQQTEFIPTEWLSVGSGKSRLTSIVAT